MAQELNLNISPYYDDYDSQKNFFRVLFKPGYPVQARELTTLQSILQNQIEQFGNHFFKEGSVVIPGNITYKNDLNAVILEDDFQGKPSTYYLDTLVGTQIKGQTSGVTAVIQEFIAKGNGVVNTTLFVKYLASGSTVGQARFLDGENLLVDDDDTIVINPETIENDDEEDIEELNLLRGQGFATTLSGGSTFKGSAVYLEEGIYFIRGFFVSVPTSILYVSPYTTTPTCKVGLRIYERILDSYDDETLNDNSQGFSNFAAPGADRLSIFVKLEQIPSDSTDLSNFIVLMEIEDGKLLKLNRKPEYNILAQEIARRTYDESGDYYINTPVITLQESLNNLKGNDGIFNENQLTYENNQPSESLATYVISPTKAYVKGFEIESISPGFFDIEKPRTTKTLADQSINYTTGATFTLNRVHGSPSIGLGTSYYITLRDSRVGVSPTTAAGKEIGISRVYDFALESGSYSTSRPQENRWDISLYDTQMYTELTLNEPITLTAPVHVKGRQSGASGFLRYSVAAGVGLTVYDTKGTFSIGEKLIFNGENNNRIIKKTRSYNINEVQSVYGTVGSAYTFSGDTLPVVSLQLDQVNISARSGGTSIVTSTENFFTGIVTTGNLVAFSNPGLTTTTLAVVQSVSGKTLTIVGVTTVIGICDGALPTTAINPSDFKVLSSNVQNSIDNTLYTVLPKKNVESVDLSETNLTIRKQFNVLITQGSTQTLTADTDETFLPFDEERYVLITENGTTQSLRQENFVYSNGSKSLVVTGLTENGNAKLIATLRKINVKSKIKNKNRAKVLVIDKSSSSASGIGSTTLNDGLVYGNYPYGTRVQDNEICLLEPDVTKVYGIFESNDTNTPDLPSVVLTALNGPTNKVGDLLVGEEFIGSTSKAIGIYVEKINDLKLGFVYINSNTFIEGETITFRESGITATVSSVDVGDRNVTTLFRLDSNQKPTIYDYSKLVRENTTKTLTRKLKVVFESASFSFSDTGDITTANSYDQFDFCEVELVDGEIRSTDTIDIRPRVSSIVATEGTRSPFEFLGRDITALGSSASDVLASDESILLTYSFYLPRIDKILLDKNGLFYVKYGIPAEIPQVPTSNDDALELATVYLPPYLCNAETAEVELKEHRRYTMADIGRLESRIENLEYYTSLSALEIEASNFTVTDENGLNRFKSGFFVDNFSTTIAQNKSTIVKNSIDTKNLELRPTHYTTSLDLQLGTTSRIKLNRNSPALRPNADARVDNNIIGSGVRKTGQLVTLDYTEVRLLNQPYATRAVSVNPFAEDFYTGTIDLYPSSDVWVDQVRVKANTVEIGDAYTETSLQTQSTQSDQQTGLAPVTWNSHETWAPPKTTPATQSPANSISSPVNPRPVKQPAAPPLAAKPFPKERILPAGPVILPSKDKTGGNMGGGMGGGFGGGGSMGSAIISDAKYAELKGKYKPGVMRPAVFTEEDRQVLEYEYAKGIKVRNTVGTQIEKGKKGLVDRTKDPLTGRNKRDERGKPQIKDPNILSKPTNNTGSVMGAGMGLGIKGPRMGTIR
jgi:hypothetical protein